ncbi:uncharacterized protein ELE39_003031 [Cryptosporidium sp. chipmunk genotype I]|uniref:uncharacterized protein n=1 Tax=Cryptosporidium sp. chipmunk genotype I TaxID=1280935 RepID=UPI00351AAB40|nr:hypothetical protein ELE39_003031 [Cryptosporidium sp. chipmunk genotype I]
MECLICFADLDEINSVDYKTSSDSSWFKSLFCIECIATLKKTQYQRYCDLVTNTKCLKEQKSLLKRGPPINIYDKHGFPECGENEVFMLCKSNSRDIICPKLEGSLVGEDRMKYWEYLKQFISKDLLEENSKDEENEYS